MRLSLAKGTTLSLLAAFALACDTTQPTPSITLTLGVQTLEITQGQNNTVTVQVARSNFNGDVALAASGLPNGVTASFNPASLTGSGSSSNLTLTASNTAAPGTATITVEASGTGVTTQTASFSLAVNVAGAYTLSAPSSVTVSQGSSATAAIGITRTGGFAQSVALAASGLPSGVTASFDPAAATGASSTLTFTASSSAATGTSTVTITGTTAGLANQTTTLSLTVAQPGTTLSIDFCSDDIPTWVAFQNEDGPWTRVIPDANGTVTFSASGRVGLAFVEEFSSTDVETGIFFATVTELEPINGVPCDESLGSGTKTLNGSVAGVSGTEAALISMGFSSAFATASTPSFTLQNVADGAVDLLAVRTPDLAASPQTSDRIILRRGLNLASGSTIPTLDFAASEAVAPATPNLTLSGLTSGEDNFAGVFFFTSTGTFASLWTDDPTADGTVPYAAVPSTLTAAGDLHEFFLIGEATDGSTHRGAFSFFRDPGNRTISLGAVVGTPTITTAATSPYVRLRAQLASQADYGNSVDFFFDQGGAGRFVELFATSGYFGGTPATWDLTIPDLSGAAGWNNSWGLQAGQSTEVDVDVFGGTGLLFAEPTEGMSFKFAGRQVITSTTQAITSHMEKHQPMRDRIMRFGSRRMSRK